MPMRLHCHRKSALAALAALIMLACAALGGCASTPAEPVPFKQVPAERIVRPGYTEPLAGLVAVDVRRERSRDVIVRFRNALVYVDGERVTDLMNGEHVVSTSARACIGSASRRSSIRWSRWPFW
ncbi:hypothetical protein PQQ73_16340 [Paraburkholderia strydomiana]|jgi:hypothetical protein|uniref:Uncharacterized protein n=1 Tax=Paraburkholderia strydomiana TaxID=1245417 RepID=A0ABW9EG94_9BURK